VEVLRTMLLGVREQIRDSGRKKNGKGFLLNGLLPCRTVRLTIRDVFDVTSLCSVRAVSLAYMTLRHNQQSST
jgi:hypothetical protein